MLLADDIQMSEIQHPISQDRVFGVKISHKEDLMAIVQIAGGHVKTVAWGMQYSLG